MFSNNTFVRYKTATSHRRNSRFYTLRHFAARPQLFVYENRELNIKKSRRKFIREEAVITGVASVAGMAIANSQTVSEAAAAAAATPSAIADMSDCPAIQPAATTKDGQLAAVTTADKSALTTNAEYQSATTRTPSRPDSAS